MRYSQLLIPTVKEVPAEAEVPSHQLMIRAGFIRKLASGTYTYLPLGWRCIRKIMDIVRKEMDATGAQEIMLPAVQPIELWQKTGRDVDYGETMSSLDDGQWLLIAAHLKGADYFKEMEISRLVLKAKMRDLREFAQGKISESTAASRVIVEEY